MNHTLNMQHRPLATGCVYAPSSSRASRPVMQRRSLLAAAQHCRRRNVAANAAAAAAAAAPKAPGNNDTATAAATAKARVDTTLADWIVKNGGAVRGVELVYSGGDSHSPGSDDSVSRQLLAARDLEPGEALIEVPAALQVRDASPNTDPRLAAVMATAPRAAGRDAPAWQFCVALQLIADRLQGPAALRAPYIAHLPGVAPGVPPPPVLMRLTDGELSELQDARLAADASAQAHFAREFARGALAALPARGPGADPFGGVEVDEGLLEWGIALAMSRSFGFRRGGHAMVPLIDMADHESADAANAEIRADADGRVRMHATARIPRGQPITLCYGRHSNADFALAYGFVPRAAPGGAADAFTFAFDADWALATVQQFLGIEGGDAGSGSGARPTDGLRTWQRTLLAEMGLLRPRGGDNGDSAGSSGSSSSGAIGGSIDTGGSGIDVGGGNAGSVDGGDDPYLDARIAAAAAAAAAASTASSRQRSSISSSNSSSMASSDGGDGLFGGQQQREALATIGGDPPVSGALLAAMRVMLGGDDRKAVKAAHVSGALGDWHAAPLGPAREALVAKALLGLATVLYAGLPTTIQRDAALLRADDEAAAGAAGAAAMSPGARLAVEYRLAMKRGLEAAAKKLLARAKELGSAAA